LVTCCASSVVERVVPKISQNFIFICLAK
jgi:hypothetical protein